MTDSALEYNKLIIEANRLGRIMRLLHQKAELDMEIVLDDLYDGELDTLSERLWGIGTVLKLLRETPNAFINNEALQAIRGVIEEAAMIEQLDWSKNILAELESEIAF